MKCENDLMEDFFYNVRGKMVRINFLLIFYCCWKMEKLFKMTKGWKINVCVMCVTVFFFLSFNLSNVDSPSIPSIKSSCLKIANPSYSTPAEIKIFDHQEKKLYIFVYSTFTNKEGRFLIFGV